MPVLELEWLTTDNCSGSSDNTMNLNGECWMARRLWNSTASLPRNQSMEMDIPLFGNPRCKQLVETGIGELGWQHPAGREVCPWHICPARGCLDPLYCLRGRSTGASTQRSAQSDEGPGTMAEVTADSSCECRDLERRCPFVQSQQQMRTEVLTW